MSIYLLNFCCKKKFNLLYKYSLIINLIILNLKMFYILIVFKLYENILLSSLSLKFKT